MGGAPRYSDFTGLPNSGILMTDLIVSESGVDATSPPRALTLMAEFARKVTFASHQNDVPVLLKLIVENLSDTPLDNLRLSVFAEPAIFGTREWTIDRLDAGTKLRIADRKLPLAGGMLDKLTDRLQADVRVALCKGDERPDRAGSWVSKNGQPDLLDDLARG